MHDTTAARIRRYLSGLRLDRPKAFATLRLACINTAIVTAVETTETGPEDAEQLAREYVKVLGEPEHVQEAAGYCARVRWIGTLGPLVLSGDLEDPEPTS